MFGELPVTLANPLVNESFSAIVGWKARTIKYNLVILIYPLLMIDERLVRSQVEPGRMG